MPSPFLASGKTALVSLGNLKVVSDFDEIALVGTVLQAIRTCECDGGVEGGVSSSSDDEKESAEEEVSEMREGVREIGGLTANDNDESTVGKAVVLMWRFGSAAILRLRGLVEDFTDGTISVFGGWGFGGKPDVLAATGDTSEDGSGFLESEAQAYLRFSCVLRSASEVVTDILPRRAVNEETSTLQSTNGLAGGVSLN